MRYLLYAIALCTALVYLGIRLWQRRNQKQLLEQWRETREDRDRE